MDRPPGNDEVFERLLEQLERAMEACARWDRDARVDAIRAHCGAAKRLARDLTPLS